MRLFAILRERAGSSSIEVELPDQATVADAFKALSERPPLEGILDRLTVRMAVNREYATMDTKLASGDELALIPPVSGGDPGADAGREPAIHVRVTSEPLSAEALSAAVAVPGAGAIVTFQGVPRDVAALEYEVYAEMAEERLRAILRACLEHHGARAAAAEHRVGVVPAGEPSVIVAVSAAHRAEAFAASLEAIDEIKAQAPIWKRELVEDGSQRHSAASGRNA